MNGLQVPVVRPPAGDNVTAQVPLDLRKVCEQEHLSAPACYTMQSNVHPEKHETSEISIESRTRVSYRCSSFVNRVGEAPRFRL